MTTKLILRLNNTISPRKFMESQTSSLRPARIRPSKSNPRLNTRRWPEADSSLKRTNSECLRQPPDIGSTDSAKSHGGTVGRTTHHNETQVELEFQEMPIVSKIPTRLHGMRQLVGFRKYNAFLELSSRALQLCSNIESLIDRRQEYAETAFARVNAAIEDLNVAEFRVLQECDRILLYEQKNHELQFLKRNVEACIQKSIGVVREQLPAFDAAASDNCAQLNEVLQRQWLDHNQYRFAVASLQDYMRLAQRSSTTMVADWERISEAAELAKIVRAFVVDSLNCNPLKKYMDSGVNLEILQDYTFNKLKPAEKSLTTSLKKCQAVTEVLIGLASEIRATERLLNVQGQKLAVQHQNRKQQDLYEEERLLLDVIFNGREYDKEQARKEREACQLQSLDVLPPLTPAERKFAQDASPVWARSWQATPTKILKHRGGHGGSPRKKV